MPLLVSDDIAKRLADLPAPANRAPNWHPDPLGGTGLRWWDGSGWTDQVNDPAATPAGAGEAASGGGEAAGEGDGGESEAAGEKNVVYVKAAGNGMAVAALVCGVVGALFGLIPILFFVALPLGVLAIVFGFVGRRKASRDPLVGRKTMATWGVVCGCLAIILGIVGIVIVNDATEELEDSIDKIDREFRESEQQLDAELEEFR